MVWVRVSAMVWGHLRVGKVFLERLSLKPHTSPGGYPPLLETPDYACCTAGLLNFCDSKSVALIVTPFSFNFAASEIPGGSAPRRERLEYCLTLVAAQPPVLAERTLISAVF